MSLRTLRARDPEKSLERARRGKTGYDRREALAGYLFISPWIIGFLVFTAGAMIYSLVISFSSYNLATGAARPIGFANYANLFDDPRVATSLANTLFYAVRRCHWRSPWRWAWPCCSPECAEGRVSSAPSTTCRR